MMPNLCKYGIGCTTPAKLDTAPTTNHAHGFSLILWAFVAVWLVLRARVELDRCRVREARES